MGDLISREAVLKELDNKNSQYEIIINIEDDDSTKDLIDKTLKAYRRILKQMISNQKTAYDVKKVVEKLKRLQEDGIPTRSAINIVKGALRDDKSRT